MSAVASAEILYALLYKLGVSYPWIALAPVLIGLISETRDYFCEHEFEGKIRKHLLDLASWIGGGVLFIIIEWLKG